MEQPVSEAFIAIMNLGEALGVREIAKLDGCWEHRVDDQWFIVVNGHSEPTKCSTGAGVPPFSAYIEFNGWPAGIIHPHAGVIAAGTEANEDAFIDAVNAATRRAST